MHVDFDKLDPILYNYIIAFGIILIIILLIILIFIVIKNDKYIKEIGDNKKEEGIFWGNGDSGRFGE
jgi:hypothetical protein